jgi:hypothetical protein
VQLTPSRSQFPGKVWICNPWLGGKDHYQADRQIVDQLPQKWWAEREKTSITTEGQT